jgi:hypothetical protein
VLTPDVPLHQQPYHLGFVGADLETTMAVLGAQFGWSWGNVKHAEDLSFEGPDGPVEISSARTVWAQGAAPLGIEVIWGAPGTTWHTDREVEFHHFAYWSADVAGDCERLAEHGWELELTVRGDDGRPSVFAYLLKVGHPRLEVVDVDRYGSHCEMVGWAVPTDIDFVPPVG